MPNWCENYIIIKGPKNKIKILYDKIKKEKKLLGLLRPEPDYNETPVMDISKPMSPPSIRKDSCWDWRVINWGTKYDIDKYVDMIEYNEEEDIAVIKGFFNTPWSPPVIAVKYYEEMNPDINITLYYFEPLISFAGIYKNGEEIIYEKVNSKTYDKLPRELVDTFAINEKDYLPDDKDNIHFK